MWWGDDGTLSGAVGKGSVALDPLFLEAEKHGIDIRTARKINATENGLFGGGSGDGGSAALVEEEPVEEKQMLFSFFGGSAEDSADVPVNPFLVKKAAPVTAATASGIISAMIDGGEAAIGDEAMVVVDAKAADNKDKVATARANTMNDAEASSASASNVYKRVVEVSFTAAQLVTMAKKFSRERYVT